MALNSHSDHFEALVLIPEDIGDDMNSYYDWNLYTQPQIYLDGLARPYNMGKVMGGGSILNGMCWTRGGYQDFDAWITLGNPGWGWNDLLPYFKKVPERIFPDFKVYADLDSERKLYRYCFGRI